jgi:hypothetical protein
MSEQDDRIERDELIWQWHCEGRSVRAIAAAVNLSPTQTYRIVTAMAELYEGTDELDDDDEDDDEDDDFIAGDDYEPVPPFLYVGMARPEDRKGNPLKDLNGRRFPRAPRAVDGRGTAVANPELEVLRWCMHAEAEGDYVGAERVRADWERQLTEAGVRRDDRGRWVQD